MKQNITANTAVAYAQCPRKAFLLLSNAESGPPHGYVQILAQKERDNQAAYLDKMVKTERDIQPYSTHGLESKSAYLTNVTLKTDMFEAECSLLTKVGSHSALGHYSYEPTICVGTHSVSQEQKLDLFFVAHVLEQIQKKPPATGYIVDGTGKSHKVNLAESAQTLLPVLEPLQEWLAKDAPEEPPVILNEHCLLCQFRAACRAKAEQENNLSLLDRMTPKIMRRLERKGIFTVKQLSYTFKPRKRKKRAKNPPPVTHSLELQALAIREGKIYLQELPELNRQPVELFLDIEGIPDQNAYYLFGLLVCEGESSTHHAFWADTPADEASIWQQFVDKANEYPDAPIYHYGNYEVMALKKLANRYGPDADPLIKRLVNVNGFIYGKVYFPIYSNRLKEIGHFIGATWSAPEASGLQSLVWRDKWEESKDSKYRELLSVYNTEDCYALKLVIDELSKFTDSADYLSTIDVANQSEQQTKEQQKTHSQFEKILKFAHFGYDNKKISFHSDSQIPGQQDKSEIRRQAVRKFNEKVQNTKHGVKKIVQIPSDETCPKCGYAPLRHTTSMSRRYIIDLVLTRSGMRKTITQYVGVRGYCQKCQVYFAPALIRTFSRNQIYGHGLGAWVVYQRVGLRLPYDSIIESLYEQFGEKISRFQSIKFIKRSADLYAETEKMISQHLLRSPFVHIDETQVNIKGTNWYVWVFTNGKYVFFKLRETREATIVHEFLANYKGTLISDFYPGYDSVACKQQKCWVHLIRDLNDDLRANPLDTEYENFVIKVRNLIVPIMEAIQKYGLRKRNLNKFQRFVESFYDEVIIHKQYRSDLVLKYQKRFVRYRESLFTFLEEDEIPWHNNTAERAIRPFAIQRDISKTPFHESATHDYLVLLSICQTCRFQGKSFFKFLFSGETDLDQFQKSKRSRKLTSEVTEQSDTEYNH